MEKLRELAGYAFTIGCGIRTDQIETTVDRQEHHLFDLSKFLRYNNPLQNENAWLAYNEKQPQIVVDDPYFYSQFADEALVKCISHHTEDKAFLKQALNQGTLVDLGGGCGEMYALAQLCGSLAYINVDKYYFSPEFPTRCAENMTFEEVIDTLPYKFNVKADMLSFISRLFPDSSNFVINGIDSSILPSRRYRKRLMQEVVRATKLGAVIFGIGSLVEEYLEPFKDTLKRVEFKDSRFAVGGFLFYKDK